MPRDSPREAPPAAAVRETAAAAGVDPGAVTDVTAFEEGLNAVFRVDRRDGPPVVLKTATFCTDAELATESVILAAVGAGTDLPGPQVVETVPADRGALSVASVLTTHREGAVVPDPCEVPPAARGRLAAESGRHLAAVHDLRLADGFGPLRPAAGVEAELRRPDSGGVVADPRHDSWAAWWSTLVAAAVAGLDGAGPLTDDRGRFADLAGPVRAALDGPPGSGSGPGDDADDAPAGPDGGVAPAFLFGDYRPANLLFDPAAVGRDPGAGPDPAGRDGGDGSDAGTPGVVGDGGDGSDAGGDGPPDGAGDHDHDHDDPDGPVVAAVLDPGNGPTGDGLLDLALAEDALVDVPFGGTDRADALRRRLRSAYRECRDRTGTALPAALDASPRYARYRLYARVRHAARFGYWSTFAREDDPEAVARRWRSFLRARLAELDG